jgi:hypothetical protein
MTQRVKNKYGEYAIDINGCVNSFNARHIIASSSEHAACMKLK